MNTQENRVTQGPDFRLSIDESGRWIIEGYASTDAVDSYNEIVDPQAFVEHLPKFAQFPIMLLNHEWFSAPIGKILEAEVRQKGLWVKALVSKTASQVWTLIDEGILKAFSIGFRGLMLENGATPSDPSIWRKIQLLEISIVNVPANAEALFSVASSRGLNLSEYRQRSLNTNNHSQGGARMEPTITLDNVRSEVSALAPVLTKAAADAAGTEVAKKLIPIETQVGDLKSQFVTMQKALQDAAAQSQTDLKAMMDKVMADMSAVMAENARLNARGLERMDDGPMALSPTEIRQWERETASEIGRAPSYVRAIVNKPEHLSSNANHQDLIRRLQQKHDEIYILDTLLGRTRGNGYNGPQSLKGWNEYARLMQTYLKTAGDPLATTVSGSGSEWIPTAFSAQLIDRMELLAVVAGRFQSFTMPTKSFTWPVRGARGGAYKVAESTSTSGTAGTSLTPVTSSVTFTATKIGSRFFTSAEEIEDSIIAILPFLQEEIATTLARGVDYTIINGDTTGTHMDTDIQLVADHVARCWKGLRKNALAASATIDSGSGAAWTVAKFLALWSKMGMFAQPAGDVAIFLNMKTWMELLTDNTFALMVNAGQKASINSGTISNPFGVDFVLSDSVRIDTNNAGVNGASGNTFAVASIANKRAFMIGDRRLLTIKTQELPQVDQIVLVGTVRKDFQQVIANVGTNYATCLGYDIG